MSPRPVKQHSISPLLGQEMSPRSLQALLKEYEMSGKEHRMRDKLSRPSEQEHKMMREGSYKDYRMMQEAKFLTLGHGRAASASILPSPSSQEGRFPPEKIWGNPTPRTGRTASAELSLYHPTPAIAASLVSARVPYGYMCVCVCVCVMCVCVFV